MKSSIDDSAVFSEGFLVVRGELVKISDHHIVYSSNLFSGDSGGAVICSDDGNVIGMHQETVNQANEKLDEEDVTLTAVNKSVESIIGGLSQGFIGIRLDTDDIRVMIDN